MARGTGPKSGGRDRALGSTGYAAAGSADVHRIVADSSYDWEYLTDERINFLYSSPACERITGYPPQAFVKDPDLLYHMTLKEDVAAVLEHDKSVKGPKPPSELEFRIRHRDGSLRWLGHECYPLFDDSGRFIGRRGSMRDITRRRQAEEALERAQLVLDRIGDMAFWVDSEARFVYVNDALCRMHGLRRDQLIGRTFLDLDPHADPVDWKERWKEVDRRGSMTFETRVRSGAGRIVPVEVTVHRVEMQGAVYQCGFARDITQRKEAERALRESEERFRVMAETVPDMLFTNRADGASEFSNARAYSYTGLPPGTLDGSGWTQTIHPDDRKRIERLWSTAIRSGTLYETELRVRGADGTYRWFVTRAHPIRDEQGKVMRWFGSATDVDDLKRAQEALSEVRDQLEVRVRERTRDLERANEALRAENAERRRLEFDILRVSELEQRRIGRDLHDGLCQELAGIAYLFELLEEGCRGGDPALRRRARHLRGLMRRAVHDAREMARGLSPAHLEGGALVPALRSLAASVRERHGIACEVRCARPVAPGDPTRATHLYRIAQEAVSNAVRHARPRRVAVTLAVRGPNLRMTIEDDGRGLRPSRRQGQGMGLPNMEHRARAIGGTLTLRRGRRGGTSVVCVAPVEPRDPEAPAPRPRSGRRRARSIA